MSRVLPFPIQVGSSEREAMITTYHSVRVYHWNNSDFERFQKLVSFFRRDQPLHHSLSNKGRHCLARMHSRWNHNDRFGRWCSEYETLHFISENWSTDSLPLHQLRIAFAHLFEQCLHLRITIWEASCNLCWLVHPAEAQLELQAVLTIFLSLTVNVCTTTLPLFTLTNAQLHPCAIQKVRFWEASYLKCSCSQTSNFEEEPARLVSTVSIATQSQYENACV